MDGSSQALTSQNLTVQPPSSAGSEHAASGNHGKMIIGAVALVLVIGGVVAFFVMKNHGSSTVVAKTNKTSSKNSRMQRSSDSKKVALKTHSPADVMEYASFQEHGPHYESSETTDEMHDRYRRENKGFFNSNTPQTMDHVAISGPGIEPMNGGQHTTIEDGFTPLVEANLFSNEQKGQLLQQIKSQSATSYLPTATSAKLSKLGNFDEGEIDESDTGKALAQNFDFSATSAKATATGDSDKYVENLVKSSVTSIQDLRETPTVSKAPLGALVLDAHIRCVPELMISMDTNTSDVTFGGTDGYSMSKSALRAAQQQANVSSPKQ